MSWLDELWKAAGHELLLPCRDRGPCPRPDDAVRGQAIVALELPDCGFGDGVETSVSRNRNLGLNHFDEFAGITASQCRSIFGVYRRYRRGVWCSPGHDGGDLESERVHVERRVRFTALR